MFPAGRVKPLRFPCKGLLAVMAPSGLLSPLALELGLFLGHGEGDTALELTWFREQAAHPAVLLMGKTRATPATQAGQTPAPAPASRH